MIQDRKHSHQPIRTVDPFNVGLFAQLRSCKSPWVPNIVHFHRFLCVFVYRGGVSFSSRNSSILLTSTFTSPLKVTNGGLVPGARSCRSAGFLTTPCDTTVTTELRVAPLQKRFMWHMCERRIVLYLLRSTVVTLKTTPLSHRIMKSLWEKGQLPMLSPSLPAYTADAQTKITSSHCE